MRRNGIKIMWGLIKLLKPLTHIMALCILLGAAGFFCAIAVTVLAANLLLTSLNLSPWDLTFSAGTAVMLVCAAAQDKRIAVRGYTPGYGKTGVAFGNRFDGGGEFRAGAP